ncbi:MAG: hypothetical protein JSW51_11910 [Gemmatimonadota bacterium]|nr:MAG: hypothetical protein JSW51_11910 [Gemmatimonadota bacterium]
MIQGTVIRDPITLGSAIVAGVYPTHEPPCGNVLGELVGGCGNVQMQFVQLPEYTVSRIVVGVSD